MGMTTRVRVTVYEVGPDGSTGSPVGDGSLVHPLLVLAHPALRRRALVTADPPRLRVALATAEQDGELTAEVVEVAGVHHTGDPAAGDDGGPVLLSLASATRAGTALAASGGTAGGPEEVRSRLAQAPTDEPAVVTDRPWDEPDYFCSWLRPKPWFCVARDDTGIDG